MSWEKKLSINSHDQFEAQNRVNISFFFPNRGKNTGFIFITSTHAIACLAKHMQQNIASFG
jgi:hypothetical protein